MGKSLVIVESDAKSKTVNRFLGNSFVVKASVGHIKNLPKNRLGVDIENNFEPEWITIRGKGKVLQKLKRLAAGSDKVIIATDPDREGEAIAHHLALEIQNSNDKIQRVLFHEITKSAIQEAIQNPIHIDLKKVEAQKARRVLDRLVGYQVSPLLWKTIYRGLSAGRVQSVALRLICQREEEIAIFIPQEYWSIEAVFILLDGDTFRSKLAKIAGEDVRIPDEDTAKVHVAKIREHNYSVSSLKTKEVLRRPYPPYTTSTFQQDAARRLGMTTKRIMTIAQQLYEGVDLPEGRVGLITYMRTDSTRLSKTAVEEVRRAIAENYGLKYVPEKPVYYKNKKSAQDAHEAIRPTSAFRGLKEVAPFLSLEQKKIYELIWKRFLACQMSPAILMQTTLEVTGGDYLFRTTGSVVKFKGFMQLYSVESEETFTLPPGLKEGMPVKLETLDPQQHFTKPPPRYNESSLVKELDNLGIGRPSTYALIISTLLDRKYVVKEARNLTATDLGMDVNRILIKQFPDIFNVDFTAQMEDELDQIESGEKIRKQVLDDFYGPFSEDMQQALEKREEIKESLQQQRNETCPQCSRDLVVKWGRNGKFVACTGYPDCKYTKPLDEGSVKSDQVCEKCGASMQVKTGRFGRFLACSRYPECKHTKPFAVGVSCPRDDCNGELVERKSRRGKLFYGCSRYPSCDFATWYQPVAISCVSCGYGMMEKRSTKTRGDYLQCPECKHQIQEKET
jgi:DNA topoisomerase-1